MERAHLVLVVYSLAIGIGSVAVARRATGDQPPVPCCAPKQFTTHYEQVAAVQSGDLPMIIVEETLDAAYDFINAVVGMEVTSRPVKEPEYKFRLVQNYTSGYQWLIQGSTCTKQPLPSGNTPMRCIPAGATYEGTFAIGLEKLKVHTWLINFSAPAPAQGQQRFTVTDYMCTPFSSAFIGTSSSVQPPATVVTSGNYMNFTSSIADPDKWFKLPPSCNNATARMADMKGILNFPTSPWIRFF